MIQEYKENLTVDELKYVCETFFKNKPLRMLGKLTLKCQIARKENNIKLAELLERDIETMKRSTHFQKAIK